MVDVKKEGIVLEKTESGFENEGVLNPAAIREDGVIHLFYRAVSKGNYSSIGYCKLNTPLVVAERCVAPVLFPQFDYESHGIEDPRIVKIEDVYYLSFTAYDGINALGALALSTDLIHWEKQGLIAPQITYEEFSRLAESKGTINEKYLRYNEQGRIRKKHGKKIFLWDKNVIFFPRRINGKLLLFRSLTRNEIVKVLERAQLILQHTRMRNYIHQQMDRLCNIGTTDMHLKAMSRIHE